MRASVGETVVGIDSSGQAPLRSHARWNAVTHLDFLCSTHSDARVVTLHPVQPTRETLLITFADDAEYRLTFDIQGRLLRASGPVEMQPYGEAIMEAEYFDYRQVGGFLISTRSRYRFSGRELSEERVTAFAGNQPSIAETLGVP